MKGKVYKMLFVKKNLIDDTLERCNQALTHRIFVVIRN